MGDQTFHQSESIAINYLRTLAIVLILSCHICQSIHIGWEYILNIGVQIFLFISGFLHGRKSIINIIEWYKHKFNKIFIQYYIYIIILLPIYYIFWSNYVNLLTSVIYAFDIQWFMVGGGRGLGPLWFMSAIAVCYFITPILQKFKRYSKLIIILLSIFALCDYLIIQKCDFYYSTMFMYCFGYYISSESIKTKYTCIGMSLIVILFIMSMPNFQYDLLFKSKVGYACALHDCTTIIIVLVVINVFMKLNIKKIDALIYWVGKYSFSIYLVHGLYCTGSPISVFKYTNPLPLAIIIFLFLTLCSALVLNKITDKVSNQLKQIG